MKLSQLAVVLAAVGSEATFSPCDPCVDHCVAPCTWGNGHHASRTGSGVHPGQNGIDDNGLPVVWDEENGRHVPAYRNGNHLLNPYNTIRPEYLDIAPSEGDLEAMWKGREGDYDDNRSPFVRPLKSQLWEAGVPNDYAPGGFNRRKFKSEAEALSYVRHKTGAGAEINYRTHQEEDAFDALDKYADLDNSAGQARAGAFLEYLESRPTKDEDTIELFASQSDPIADDHILYGEDLRQRQIRDHNLAVAHKMRDFLASYEHGQYRPDMPLDPVHPFV